MADQYDFSAFDNAVKKQESASPEKYDLSAFDNANKIEEQPGALSRMLSDAGESAANLGKGITQGVTLGAAPYIAGAIGTPISYALGTASPEGLEETFKQNVAGAKKTLEPTSQESILQKLLYKGGELGGGIIPFEATAAMGLGAKSVRGAMGAGEQVALKEAAAQGGVKGLGKELGTRFIAGAPQGAVLGGGAAAIQGESAQDIGESALTGGLISGVAGMAGLGAKNKETSAPEKLGPSELSNKVDVTPSSPTMAQIKEGWKQGYDEGRFLSTDKGAKPLREEVISATEDLAKRTTNVDNELSENIGKILDGTKKPVSITEPFNSLAKKVEELRTKNVFAEQNPQAEFVFKKLSEINPENLSPRAAFDLKEQIRDVADKLRNKDILGSKEYSGMFDDLVKDIQSSIKDQVPGYGQASNKLQQFRSSIVGQIKSGQIPEELSMPSSSLHNPIKQGNFLEDIQKLVSEIRSSENTPGKGTMIKLGEKLDQLEQVQPEIFKKLGFSGKQEFVDNLNKIADKATILNSMGKSAYTGHIGATKAVLSPSLLSKITDTGSNVAGNIARKTIKPAADIGKAAYNYSAEQLGQISQRLADSHIPGTENLADALNKAIAKNDSTRKNQVLFSILQQPSIRHLIDLNPDQKEENK